MPLTKSPDIQQQKSIIRVEGMRGIQAALDAVRVRHEHIVKPWKKAEDKPGFVTEIERKYRLIIGRVKVIGQRAESAEISVWQLLEHGTRIRWMELSGDWESKTFPRTLSSGPGRGRKLGLNFEDGPWPGIKARKWGETVAEVQKDDTEEFVSEGWKKGFLKAIGKRRR